MAGLRQDTLYLACTRPAMFPGTGVPLEVGIGILIATTEAVVLSHRIFSAPVVGAVLFVICHFIGREDPNRFRLIYLWCITRARASINAKYWAGSSAAPLPQRRARKAKEIVVSV